MSARVGVMAALLRSPRVLSRQTGEETLVIFYGLLNTEILVYLNAVFGAPAFPSGI